MRASPLKLEGYYLNELFVQLNPKFEKKSGCSALTGFHYQPDESTFEPDPITFDVHLGVGYKRDEPSRWAYQLKIESHKRPRKNFPYSFRIVLDGYFNIAGDYPEERAPLLLHVNAPSVLYSAAREILAIATGRGPYPAVVLPTVSFVDDAENLAALVAGELKPNPTKQLKPAPRGKVAKTKRASKKVSSKKRTG